MKASWRVSPWNPGTGSELANTEKLQRQRHKTVNSELEFQVCFLLYMHTLDIWRSVVIQLNAGSEKNYLVMQEKRIIFAVNETFICEPVEATHADQHKDSALWKKSHQQDHTRAELKCYMILHSGFSKTNLLMYRLYKHSCKLFYK